MFVHHVLTSIVWGSINGHQLLVLAAGLVTTTADCAAATADKVTADVAATIAPRVWLDGPSVGAVVGVC